MLTESIHCTIFSVFDNTKDLNQEEIWIELLNLFREKKNFINNVNVGAQWFLEMFKSIIINYLNI